MMLARQIQRPKFEFIDSSPAFEVSEFEYRRLLGYPRDHVLSERALELSALARTRFEKHGRPWIYVREAELNLAANLIGIDNFDFHSPSLRNHLLTAGAEQVLLVAVSAGPECEEWAREAWAESKPDEYFFLEMYGSAVVEHLTATLSGRICEWADQAELVAIPHYSPGYTGWDVAEQNRLFELMASGASQPFPSPLEVLASGMLRPKKSLLAVIGLAARENWALREAPRAPCESCAYSPCQYRRQPYRFARTNPTNAERAAKTSGAATRSIVNPPKYSINARALQKWSAERVRIDRLDAQTLKATFRFDGTTCANQGVPLAFEYTVLLGRRETEWMIVDLDCRPVNGDEGYQRMCAFLSDPDGLMGAITNEKPLLGRALDDVLQWSRDAAPAGCYCTPESRTHKWGLALEVIHYALAQMQSNNPAANSLSHD